MALEEYKRKRHFKKTPEPPPKVAHSKSGHSYLIQKHAATRLHYDFRLELDGVLLSWAIPKGPSYDPAQKRLAVHTEDHPLEYGKFEGTIPKGEYGGGTVMLWDRGTWSPIGDPREGHRKGNLKFELHGERLKGRWALVRMGKPAESGKENWLLIKENDEWAKPGSDTDAVDAFQTSVDSGRAMDEIAHGTSRVWHSNKSVQENAAPSPSVAEIQGAKRKALPAMIQPQLATLVDHAPTEAGWVHEIKYDGYRILARIDNGSVRLYTRNKNEWTGQFPSLVKALEPLAARGAWLDGEVVVLKADGTTHFQELQNAISIGREPDLTYMVFDLPYLDGYDLSEVPLIERKRLLEDLLRRSGLSDRVRYSDHIAGDGSAVYNHACRFALEGVISKRADASYIPKRTRSWLKVKCLQRQEFVVGGFSEGSGSREGFGALLLGVYNDKDELIYSGRCGTGFSSVSLRELAERLSALEISKAPFVNPPRGYDAKGVHWVKPELVVEVEFSNWTSEGILRHPSFQGLREDKSPREIRRETVAPVEAVAEEAEADAAPAAAAQQQPGAPASKRKTKSSAEKSSGRKTAHASDKRTEQNEDGSEFAGVRLTHPERVLYPEQGLTKRDLAEYYMSVADWIMPHVENRPLTLVRCPDGRHKECFFQKHVSANVGPEIHRIDIPEDNGIGTYLSVDSIAGVIALVQMGVLEIHVWGSPNKKLEYPDRMIFDLDPDPEVAWERVVEASLLIRNRLLDLGLQSFVKTTGGKGLHVVIPLASRNTWDEVKGFSKKIAEEFTRLYPDRYLAKMSKALRRGRIFIDYLRNGRGATAIAAFSTRARDGASISAPLTWEELVAGVKPNEFTIRNIGERLRKLQKDPWDGYAQIRQYLSAQLLREFGLK